MDEQARAEAIRQVVRRWFPDYGWTTISILVGEMLDAVKNSG